jgi:type IV secretory pathway TrbF-like protein
MNRILLRLTITFGIIFTLRVWISLKTMAQPLIVLTDAHGESLAFGPGHVTGSAEPARPGLADSGF